MPIVIGNITLYDAKELADTLKVTEITVRKYIRSGDLKGQKVGGRWLVSQESLRAFFDQPKPRKRPAKK